MASWIIRINSLLISVLYLFAVGTPTLSPILCVLMGWGVVLMEISIFFDKKFSILYKSLIACVIIVAFVLIIYGLFFSAQYVQVNSIVKIVGIGVSCGSVIAFGITILCMRKQLETTFQSEEVVQLFFDTLHMLVLLIVPLCSLH